MRKAAQPTYFCEPHIVFIINHIDHFSTKKWPTTHWRVLNQFADLECCLFQRHANSRLCKITHLYNSNLHHLSSCRSHPSLVWKFFWSAPDPERLISSRSSVQLIFFCSLGVWWRLIYLHEHIPGLWKAICGKTLWENRSAGLFTSQEDTQVGKSGSFAVLCVAFLEPERGIFLSMFLGRKERPGFEWSLALALLFCSHCPVVFGLLWMVGLLTSSLLTLLQKEEDSSSSSGDPPRKKPTRLAIGKGASPPLLIQSLLFQHIEGL